MVEKQELLRAFNIKRRGDEHGRVWLTCLLMGGPEVEVGLKLMTSWRSLMRSRSSLAGSSMSGLLSQLDCWFTRRECELFAKGFLGTPLSVGGSNLSYFSTRLENLVASSFTFCTSINFLFALVILTRN